MKYPFIIPFIFISLGIISNEYLYFNVPLVLILIFSLLVFIAKRELAIILLAIFSFFIGLFLNNDNFSQISDKKNIFLDCYVLDVPSIYKNFLKFNCKVKNSNYKDLEDKTVKVYLFTKKGENLDVFLFSKVNLYGNLKVKENSLNFYSYKYKIDNNNNPFIYILHLKRNLKEQFKQRTNDEILYSVGEALIFGDRQNIDNETRKIFINSGLIHLLAISGLHVGMLITILLLIFYPLRKEFRYIIVAVLISVFPFLTGLKIPVIRASLMGILFLIGKIKNFKVNSLNILFFVASLILILSPKSLFSPSFQLSFIAVLGILLFVEKHKLEVKSFYQYFFASILVSIVATIFTTPILTYHFGKFSPISIIATPIALIPIYPYIFLAVLNLLTGFQLDFLVNLMNKFGEVFIGITAFFGNLEIFYIGYKPILFFTILVLFYFIIIFLLKKNLFFKIGISLFLLFLFLFFSKGKELTNPKIIDTKKYILLKIKNECFVYMKRRKVFLDIKFNKEGCNKKYLIVKPNKKISLYSNFDKYIPINSKYKDIQFITLGKDIIIKFENRIIYSSQK